MRKIVLLLMILFFIPCFFILPYSAIAGTVTLAWDANDPQPDGYLLYQRDSDQNYNYDTPVANLPGSETTVTLNNLGEIGKSITYYWVVRAYLDKPSGLDVSGDSNEVSNTYDYTLPQSATGLEATYNEADETITVAWQQDNPGEVVNWKIYTSETQGGPYVLFDTVANTGQTTPTTTKAISVPEGTRKTIYFVVVSFKSEEIYSGNSSEVFVIVDKRVVVPPVLRITATIPVTD